MPDELGNFQTTGPSWQERAEKSEGVAAVYSPNNLVHSKWLAFVHDVCLEFAIKFLSRSQTALDFGCGIGRCTPKLSESAGTTIGVEITPGMLLRAHSICNGRRIVLAQIDGVHLPLEDQLVDLIWVSGVLRYSLLVPNPTHAQIVREFYRVLKPRGIVCNVEMYVDQPSQVFVKDFLQIGFLLRQQSIVHVYNSTFDRIALGKYRRIFLKRWWARLSVRLTELTVREKYLDNILRDYFFVYQKLA